MIAHRILPITFARRIKPFTGILIFALLIMATPVVHGQAIVDVGCVDNGGDCFEILNPNPVFINVGDEVQWLFDPSCGEPPCSGRCEINVPPGPGFPGFNDLVNVPGFSNVTPPFGQQGVFYYSLECSPAIIGTIIVGSPALKIVITGPCPGTATVDVADATAGAKIHIVYGFASGQTQIPGCPGMSVDIKKPRIAGTRTAGSDGKATLKGPVPSGVCGTLSVQAAEVSNCRKSNVANF